MNNQNLDQIVERLLAVGSGRAAEASAMNAGPEAVEIAGMMDVLSGKCGRLSFDELYEYHFGNLTPVQAAEVESVLAVDSESRALSEMLAGLPTADEAEGAGPEILPAELREQTFRAVGVGALRPTRKSLMARIGKAAMSFLDGVRGTADAMVVVVGSAFTQVVSLGATEEAEAELALAYDGSVVTEPEAAPLADLPRIRIEHGYLCMALASEQGRGVDVALVDLAGREVAVAHPNDIGVVMFNDLTPGTYGLRITRAPDA